MRLGGVCPTVIIPGIHVRLEFARTLNQKWASPYPLSARIRTDSLRAAILSREAVKRPLRVIRKRLREGFLLYDQILYIQSSNEPSGRKRQTMRRIFPLRTSAIAMARRPVSPSRFTRTGPFVLTHIREDS